MKVISRKTVKDAIDFIKAHGDNIIVKVRCRYIIRTAEGKYRQCKTKAEAEQEYYTGRSLFNMKQEESRNE